MKFDSTDRRSPFLGFVAEEFRRRGTDLRRQLSRKTEVHAMLEDQRLDGERIGLARQHAVLTSSDQITSEMLGERTALKFAYGWSAQGVMLLERMGEGRYFDHMSLREWTVNGIRKKQETVASSFSRRPPAWIIEELLVGSQPGAVPFDYKFFMFQGQIGLVLQIDRNSSPPRIAFLRGDLQPMVEDHDYKVTSENYQSGVPLVPRSAATLSRWAIELSQMTDSPFVSVDLYDTDKGPAFGEFTFSPGGTHKRAIMFSQPVIRRLDRMFVNAQKKLDGETAKPLRGFSAAVQSADTKALLREPTLSVTEYERLAYYLYNQGSLGGVRLAEAQERLIKDGADTKISHYIGRAHKATAEWVKARHKHSADVLREAVRQVTEEERPVKDVAAEVDLPRQRLAHFVKQAQRTSEQTNTRDGG